MRNTVLAIGIAGAVIGVALFATGNNHKWQKSIPVGAMWVVAGILVAGGSRMVSPDA